ncbi:hypothetical protein BGZ94_003197, partial [Podila epigama]
MAEPRISLAAFMKANPLDLGPVAFVQWARGHHSKQDLHSQYLAMASDAASSEDLNIQKIGKEMQELWVKEKTALTNYWKEKEPLRQLRTRNIISAAKDSSKLQTAVGRQQLRRALQEIQQMQQKEQQQEQVQDHDQDQDQDQQTQQQPMKSDAFCVGGTLIPSDSDDDDFSDESSRRTSFGSTGEPSSKLRGNPWVVRGTNISQRLLNVRSDNMSHQQLLQDPHDLMTLNFIFTKEIIKRCFVDNEKEIEDVILKVNLPEVPCQDVDFVVKCALAAASQDYFEFKKMLRTSNLKSDSLAGDILTTYTTTNSLWQARTGLDQNEDTYIKRSVMPMIDAVFGSLDVVEHWQRDQLPVPRGYEEVLQSDFFGEVDQLCFAFMEVKKPGMSMDDIADDIRKLPSMMKLALNMLIHKNVEDAAVIGFLVNENICEVFAMNLEHEALHIPKSLGRFKLPQDHLDISSLLLALGPLTAAKRIASKMVSAIKRRPLLGAGKYSPLTRPSYHIFGSNVPSSGDNK